MIPATGHDALVPCAGGAASRSGHVVLRLYLCRHGPYVVYRHGPVGEHVLTGCFPLLRTSGCK